MKALDYDVQRALDILRKGRAPRGVNAEIINEFMKSGKDIAVVNIREGITPGAKGASLRCTIKQLGAGAQVSVYERAGTIVLVRRERRKALGL